MWQMWFDICIFGLINERSCSPGGKSHTGRFGGLCWRLEPWRKASSCVSWRSSQVGSCCSPHLNLYSLKTPAFFLTLPKVTRNCVHLVLRLWIVLHDSCFSPSLDFKNKLFPPSINTFLWESLVFNAQAGSPGAQGGKTGSLRAPGQGVNHWRCTVWPARLKNPEMPHRLFQKEGVEVVGWLRVLTVMEVLMCGIELWYWEFNTSMAQFPVSNYI